MTIEEIIARIRADAPRRGRMKRLYDYYRAKHDILGRLVEDGKPNNRLAHDFPRYIANAYTGYLFGEPVSYTGTDEGLIAAATACFSYNDEQAENSRLGLDCAICGEAWEIVYMDADARVRFTEVSPIGCIGVEDETIEHALTALIRYYDTTDVVTGQMTGHVEVYEPDAVRRYTVGGGIGSGAGGIPRLEGEEYHAFGDVPAVRYLNNSECMGDFESVLSLIDAYDLMQSESLNDQEYFTDAYLMLKGIGEMDNAADMKRKRVLLMPQDGDAKWLIKSQSDQIPENIKTRLSQDIHRFSGCPDMSDQNFAGNASGVAIRYKMLQFENNTSIKEREFKRGLQRRLELLCNIWRVLAVGSFDWRNALISFKRALPQNLLELSQTLGNIQDLLSDETKRSLLPLDIDEETERQRIADERAGGMFTAWELAHPEGDVTGGEADGR